MRSNRVVSVVIDILSPLSSLRKMCPYSELLWSAFSHIRTRITPDTDIFHAVVVLNLHSDRSVISQFNSSELKQCSKRSAISQFYKV